MHVENYTSGGPPAWPARTADNAPQHASERLPTGDDIPVRCQTGYGSLLTLAHYMGNLGAFRMQTVRMVAEVDDYAHL